MWDESVVVVICFRISIFEPLKTTEGQVLTYDSVL